MFNHSNVHSLYHIPRLLTWIFNYQFLIHTKLRIKTYHNEFILEQQISIHYLLE